MHHSSDNNPQAVITQHLLICGHVQGVGYRWSMVQAAQQRAVQGWVRNRRDGSVEALVSGPADAVQSLVDWAHQGPPHARVDAVSASAAAGPAEPLSGFVQKDTV